MQMRILRVNDKIKNYRVKNYKYNELTIQRELRNMKQMVKQ